MNIRTVLAFAILALPSATYGQLAAEYPPMGRMVDIGGRKLHVHCTGAGMPTVVLMAGGGAFAIDWALVQPRVAETTRVCSYDRAGLGWSDPGPADETVEQTVADLRKGLQAAGEKGPYILVGASIAGIFIRAYQHSFPGDVAALVFANSSNSVGVVPPGGGGGLLWKITDEVVRSAYPPPAAARGPRPTGTIAPFDRLPANLQTTRVWLSVRLWERWAEAFATPEATLSWRREFLREFEEVDKDPRPLGMLPVVVVASGPRAAESDRTSRAGAGPQLNFLSGNTVHIEAAGSGHEIHLFQPARVVEGITQALAAVRTGRALPLAR
jgi:pimeloyl-ACP methyl ester carboxylesterase